MVIIKVFKLLLTCKDLDLVALTYLLSTQLHHPLQKLQSHFSILSLEIVSLIPSNFYTLFLTFIHTFVSLIVMLGEHQQITLPGG